MKEEMRRERMLITVSRGLTPPPNVRVKEEGNNELAVRGHGKLKVEDSDSRGSKNSREDGKKKKMKAVTAVTMTKEKHVMQNHLKRKRRRRRRKRRRRRRGISPECCIILVSFHIHTTQIRKTIVTGQISECKVQSFTITVLRTMLLFSFLLFFWWCDQKMEVGSTGDSSPCLKGLSV